MAFLSAIGIVGSYEAYYRNGIGGLWWNLLMMPVGVVIALSGWVIHRCRQARALTMAQFLEMRYSRKFRVFAGFVALISRHAQLCGVPYGHGAVRHLLLRAAGRIQPARHDPSHLPYGHAAHGQRRRHARHRRRAGDHYGDRFFQGLITTAAFLALLYFVATKFGWTMIVDTLMASETVDVISNPDMVERLDRKPGVSMLNPFRQGGAGYLTAARTPHEAKMGNVLNSWRWLMITVATVIIVVAVYTLVWNPAFGTAYNLAHEVSSETRREWWTVMLGIQVGVSVFTAIWYALGGTRDIIRLCRDFRMVETNDADDGSVRGDHAVADETIGVDPKGET